MAPKKGIQGWTYSRIEKSGTPQIANHYDQFNLHLEEEMSLGYYMMHPFPSLFFSPMFKSLGLENKLLALWLVRVTDPTGLESWKENISFMILSFDLFS